MDPELFLRGGAEAAGAGAGARAGTRAAGGAEEIKVGRRVGGGAAGGAEKLVGYGVASIENEKTGSVAEEEPEATIGGDGGG